MHNRRRQSADYYDESEKARLHYYPIPSPLDYKSPCLRINRFPLYLTACPTQSLCRPMCLLGFLNDQGTV